jgi:hypothetical protein
MLFRQCHFVPSRHAQDRGSLFVPPLLALFRTPPLPTHSVEAPSTVDCCARAAARTHQSHKQSTDASRVWGRIAPFLSPHVSDPPSTPRDDWKRMGAAAAGTPRGRSRGGWGIRIVAGIPDGQRSVITNSADNPVGHMHPHRIRAKCSMECHDTQHTEATDDMQVRAPPVFAGISVMPTTFALKSPLMIVRDT